MSRIPPLPVASCPADALHTTGPRAESQAMPAALADLPPVVVAQIDTALGILRERFGAALAGVHLFGSAVATGLQPHSDIDLLAVVTRHLDAADRRHLVAALLACSGRYPVDGPMRPLEVTVVAQAAIAPWQFPPRAGLVYGEWLRTRFEAGDIAAPPPDPDLAVVLAMARQNSRTLHGQAADALLPPVPRGDLVRAMTEHLPLLLDTLHSDTRNVILTLARMWCTLETGDILAKDAAAQRLLPHVSPAARDVLLRASDAYHGTGSDDWHAHTAAVSAFAREAQQAILRRAHSA